MKIETYQAGMPSWTDLATSDEAGALAFYSGLFGWSFSAVEMGAANYTIVSKGEKQVAGAMPLSALPRQDVPPHWMGYVSVPDVDEVVAAAKANGGGAPAEPVELEGVGRFAFISMCRRFSALSSWPLPAPGLSRAAPEHPGSWAGGKWGIPTICPGKWTERFGIGPPEHWFAWSSREREAWSGEARPTVPDDPR